MKQISITIALALICTIVNAQNITGSHQVRVNDEVKKQQVEYAAVDSTGHGMVWDLSEVEFTKWESTANYTEQIREPSPDLFAAGQCHNIEGDYLRDKSYEYITIKGNRLYYIERQPHLSIRNTDTLAICDVRIIDDHVIEINSTYKEDVERSMMISQFVGDEIVDSIDIKFDFPYSDKQNPWKMQVYYNLNASPLESYDFHVKIPADSKGFFFEVFPAFCVQHLLDGHYWGLLYYLSDPYEIKERCKSITVSNYMLNAGFFERYYPKNEYLYVKENEIHWKGKIFKKIKTRQKWM